MRATTLFCLALSASLSAQDITVKAQSDVSSLATSGSTSDFRTVKAGSSVTVAETASHSESLQVYNVSASTTTGYASFTQSGMASYVDVINNKFVYALTAKFLHNGTTSGDGVASTSPSNSAGSATPGACVWLVTIRHPSNVVGDLLLRWRAQQNPRAKLSVQVDVGNDNSVDFSADSTQESTKELAIPVTFNNGPLVIKVTTDSFSDAKGEGGYHNFNQSLTLNLVKKGVCNLVTYGSSCGGAKLDAGMFKVGGSSILQMKLSGGVKNGFFVRVVGTTRINVPLPGNCPLLADPSIVELLSSDSNGAYTEAFTMPADKNYVVTFQYVPFDLVGGNIVTTSTNAWELSCSGF